MSSTLSQPTFACCTHLPGPWAPGWYFGRRNTFVACLGCVCVCVYSVYVRGEAGWRTLRREGVLAVQEWNSQEESHCLVTLTPALIFSVLEVWNGSTVLRSKEKYCDSGNHCEVFCIDTALYVFLPWIQNFPFSKIPASFLLRDLANPTLFFLVISKFLCD